MDTNKIIQLATIITAGLLIISILLQSQGAGLGGIFGGEGNAYRTKRGAEKVIFISTIVLAVIFFGLAAVRLFLINTI